MAATALQIKKHKPDDSVYPRKSNGEIDWSQIVSGWKRSLRENTRFMPQAVPYEEAVLGAVLLDKKAIGIVVGVFQSELDPFYLTEHNLIWRACVQLFESGTPIDLLTATDRLTKNGDIEKVGGAYYIAQLTNRVTSSANVEFHARVIFQKLLQRKMIMLCSNTIEELYDETTDIFDTIDTVLKTTSRYENPLSPITAVGMDEAMIKAAKSPIGKQMFGNIITQYGIYVLFAQTGVGKSILAIQMADNWSKGKDFFGGYLKNEAGRQKVLILDLEMGDNDLQNRYMNDKGEVYNFESKEWLIRASINENSQSDFSDIGEKAKSILNQLVQKHEPDVLIIDNMYALTNGNTADQQVAQQIVNTLKSLRMRFPKLTILIVAHTPKMPNPYTKMTVYSLAGSAVLGNFLSGVFALNFSRLNKNFRYLIEVKRRGAEIIFDDQNVLTLIKEKNDKFLGFNLHTIEHLTHTEIPTLSEDQHIVQVLDDTNKDDIIDKARELKKSGLGLRKIKDDLNLNISHTHLNNLIKKADSENEYKVSPRQPGEEDLPF